MIEIGTYRLSDFILFSKETLFAVYEAYNLEIWPWQILWLILSFGICFSILRPSPLRSRIVFAISTGAWLWVALIFHLQYFLQINWVARAFAYFFLAEALLLFCLGVLSSNLQIGHQSPKYEKIGLAIFMISAFLPIEILWGQEWSQILLFGWGPERTALGTVGLLLTTRNRRFQLLPLILPLAWCLITVLMFMGIR